MVKRFFIRVVGFLGQVQGGQEEERVEQGVASEGLVGDDVYPEGVGGFIYGDGRAGF